MFCYVEECYVLKVKADKVKFGSYDCTKLQSQWTSNICTVQFTTKTTRNTPKNTFSLNIQAQHIEGSQNFRKVKKK